MLIEFDPDKDRINQLKHGVSLKLAERIDMRHAVVVDDLRDFEGETRQRGYVVACSYSGSHGAVKSAA